MLGNLFWLFLGGAIGLTVGLTVTAYDSRASRAWEWIKTQAKRLGIGRNGQ